jgi:hypothetical protein
MKATDPIARPPKTVAEKDHQRQGFVSRQTGGSDHKSPPNLPGGGQPGRAATPADHPRAGSEPGQDFEDGDQQTTIDNGATPSHPQRHLGHSRMTLPPAILVQTGTQALLERREFTENSKSVRTVTEPEESSGERSRTPSNHVGKGESRRW